MSLEKLRALPAVVDLMTAAEAWGIGRTLAYELARNGEFPCDVRPIGRFLRVRKVDLMRSLGFTIDGEPLAPEASAPPRSAA